MSSLKKNTKIKALTNLKNIISRAYKRAFRRKIHKDPQRQPKKIGLGKKAIENNRVDKNLKIMISREFKRAEKNSQKQKN